MATQDIMSMIRSNSYLTDGTLRYRAANEGTAERWLFVDNEGVIRSATAQVLASKAEINARAVGADYIQALVPISLQLANWAQKIIFLDQASYDKTAEIFQGYEYDWLSVTGKNVILDITDTYFYMQPQLITALKEALPELNYNV
jgi:predicted protein tyrosine phosphatase